MSLVDIYPTLIELAHLPLDTRVDGTSLVPLLTQPDQDWPPALMTAGQGNHAGSEQLYDHRTDPWEWTNLAANPHYADVIAKHRKWIPGADR